MWVYFLNFFQFPHRLVTNHNPSSSIKFTSNFFKKIYFLSYIVGNIRQFGIIWLMQIFYFKLLSQSFFVWKKNYWKIHKKTWGGIHVYMPQKDPFKFFLWRALNSEGNVGIICPNWPKGAWDMAFQILLSSLH